MAIKDIFKVSRKTFFNPRAWIGYDSLKDQTKSLWLLIKSATTTQTPAREETFAEAMQRFNLKEQDLKPLARRYFGYAVLFVLLAILDGVYGLYLLFYHHGFLGFVLSLALCSFLLAQAFKYHFWYFQIKNRKLGCTLQEWRKGRIDQ